MTRKDAAGLLGRLDRLENYVKLQVCLYCMFALKKLARPPMSVAAGLAVSNLAIEADALDHRRRASRVLHAPGILILRCIPGISFCIGNIAILKAEPILHGVALRFCERFFRRIRLGFLNPIYVRPAMKLLKWLCGLEWPIFTV